MYKIVTKKLLSKIEFNQWKNSEKVQTVDDLNFIFSTEIFKWKVLSGIEDATKDAVLGAPAPDVPILNVSSKKTINLLSLSSSGRPLVLNFGSCSWPPFMAVLESFGQMSAKYSHCADFATIYIEEAHPSEKANFSGNISIATHKNLQERIEASQILVEAKSSNDNYEIFVDLMDNKACSQYAALPERLYVVLDGKIIFEGQQGPFGYSISGVEEVIKKYSLKMGRRAA